MIPVQTQILDVVGERLKNITEANGYFTTLQKIERANLEPFKNQDMPAINYHMADDNLVKPINTAQHERVISVLIEYYTLTRDRIFTDIANELYADIAIALERDVSAPLVADQVSIRLGKIVARLEFETMTPAIGNGQSPYCGAIVLVRITYWVDRHDPFTLID